MQPFSRVLLAVVIICTSSFAGSTKCTSTFRSPKFRATDLSGKKVACFVVIPNEELRSAREETVATELRRRGVDAVAGYAILPGELVKDREKSKEFLKKAGVGSTVMIRLVSDEEKTSYLLVPTPWYSQPSYNRFSGYWNHGWSSGYQETVWKERVATLEILIYSIDDDELLWAGKGNNKINPKDITKFVKDLIDSAGRELHKEGMVPK